MTDDEFKTKSIAILEDMLVCLREIRVRINDMNR